MMLGRSLLPVGSSALALRLSLAGRDFRGDSALLEVGMLLRGELRRLPTDLLDSKPASAARRRYCSTKCRVADTA